MTNSIFHILAEFFARYGYWVIFFGVMLENAGLPIPGETVLLFAGFLAFQGKLRLPTVILAAIAGATIGDSLGFALGRYGGTPLLNRLVRRVPWIARQYDEAHRLFLKYGQWAVFTARFIAGLRVFAGILAGVLLMPYGRFLMFNFSGAVCWAMTIGSAGYLFGSKWERIVNFLEQLNRLTFVILCVVVLALVLIRVLKRKRPG